MAITRAKSIKRRAWTKDDLRVLKSLAKQKNPAPVIARKLKRTVPSVRTKAVLLGMSLDSRR